MITLKQALKIAFSNAEVDNIEQVDLIDSLGRVLARDVFSDVDMPPFNKSAMDGYACRRDDLHKELSLLEVIPAGSVPTKKIEEGQCSKIMTGAMVPEGADVVFMVEHSEILPSGKIKCVTGESRANICLQGEDVKTGDKVLTAGTMIGAQHVAVLASVGCTNPWVYVSPTIGVLSTGSELIEPSGKPAISQIRNSNGPQLCAQAKKHGFVYTYYGNVSDVKDLMRLAIQKSVNENDVTILSGGVSVGDFDFVPSVIEDLGFTIHFNKINIKPGQHTTFASRDNKYIIGLPGNPVSSFIQFEIFVLPFLHHLMNFAEKDFFLKLKLSHDYARKKGDREECLPVELTENNEVRMANYNGSAHIHAYNRAFGYVCVAPGVQEIKKGEWVNVRPL